MKSSQRNRESIEVPTSAPYGNKYKDFGKDLSIKTNDLKNEINKQSKTSNQNDVGTYSQQ